MRINGKFQNKARKKNREKAREFLLSLSYRIHYNRYGYKKNKLVAVVVACVCVLLFEEANQIGKRVRKKKAKQERKYRQKRDKDHISGYELCAVVEHSKSFDSKLYS